MIANPPSRPRRATNVPKPELPPHDTEAEQACLGAVMLSMESQQEVEALLMQMRPAYFFDLKNRILFEEMVRMKMEGHAIDMMTLNSWLKAHKKLDDCGGLAAISKLTDMIPSSANFSYHLDIIKEKHHRRWLIQKSAELVARANSEELKIEDTHRWLEELGEATGKASVKRPTLRVWRAKELLEYKIPENLRLVGDNEISMGYDGVSVVAGPGSSGKSLCVTSLALAGAIGTGTWMGRKVHRQFKTVIIQAENGSVRIKAEIEALKKKHPDVDIENHIFISEPPEGGIPFHSPDFRAAVRRAVAELGVSLVVVDPWSQVASEDKAKEVIEKIGEMRSCFPADANCPHLMIIAHTRKPRPEDVQHGRGLAALVSGSVALPNTARSVYVLLPWSDDMTDDRIYWACPKLNNGVMYAPTVWHRRFGTFFEHDQNTDPTTWGKDAERENAAEERRVIKYEVLKEAFGTTPGMKRTKLVAAILEEAKKRGISVGESTVFRAIGNDGYLREYLTEVAGIFGLNAEKKEKKK